jgi:hypothetical protein
VPYLPVGWSRDVLAPALAPLKAQDRIVTLLGPLQRATWPHAKAGFFAVAKQIANLLGACGIGGCSPA